MVSLVFRRLPLLFSLIRTCFGEQPGIYKEIGEREGKWLSVMRFLG
jgi:hypothetical protein